MVLQYNPVPIIQIESYGNLSAPTICNQMNIQSQNDQEKLLEANKIIYTESFNNGIFLVDPYANKKVSDVKNLVRSNLIVNRQAYFYYEPKEQVISQLNDECVVALVDQ